MYEPEVAGRAFSRVRKFRKIRNTARITKKALTLVLFI